MTSGFRLGLLTWLELCLRVCFGVWVGCLPGLLSFVFCLLFTLTRCVLFADLGGFCLFYYGGLFGLLCFVGCFIWFRVFDCLFGVLQGCFMLLFLVGLLFVFPVALWFVLFYGLVLSFFCFCYYYFEFIWLFKWVSGCGFDLGCFCCFVCLLVWFGQAIVLGWVGGSMVGFF